MYGYKGVGKTSYSLHLASEVFKSWKVALNHLFFDPIDGFNHLYKYHILTGKRERVIIFDDAGDWMSKYRYNEEWAKELTEFLKLIRSVTAGIIFTDVDLGVLKGIRDQVKLRIRLSKYNKTYSYATCYTLVRQPNLKCYPRKLFIDIFPRKYPDKTYKEYELRRKSHVKFKAEKLLKVLKNE